MRRGVASDRGSRLATQLLEVTRSQRFQDLVRLRRKKGRNEAYIMPCPALPPCPSDFLPTQERELEAILGGFCCSFFKQFLSGSRVGEKKPDQG